MLGGAYAGGGRSRTAGRLQAVSLANSGASLEENAGASQRRCGWHHYEPQLKAMPFGLVRGMGCWGSTGCDVESVSEGAYVLRRSAGVITESRCQSLKLDKNDEASG